MTSSDPWLSGGSITDRGVFRLESSSARRVKLPGEAGAEEVVWISHGQGWKLFAWEDWGEPDFFYDRSRDHTTLDRFTHVFFCALYPLRFPYHDLYRTNFGDNPVAALWELGADASPALEVTMLYRLRHICFPVTDEPDVVASFGWPIAVWKNPTQPRDVALDEGSGITRIVILFSLDDDATDRLTQKIQASRLLREVSFNFAYALSRYGQSRRPEADALYDAVHRAISDLRAQAVIVHYGVAFKSAPEVFREVIERIRNENQDLLLATDGLGEPGPATLHGIGFDQPGELHEIVRVIFG